MVKPTGSFEWGVVLGGTAVVTTIVAAYAIGWERAAGESFVPVRADVKAATSVAMAPAAQLPPPAPRPVERAGYVFGAVRGDSWLLVREGSYRGRALFEGVLFRGEQLRLRGLRLWVRFGAASSIELRVNGRPARLPSFGTFDAYVSSRGVRADRVSYATAAQSP